ncbi:multiple PDZ domain protein-like [Battus philenor]|uniref:multiple PDZ domain protein-like n=1 Tax=Battus philenor TaxID=42288 RepID=UPI0035CFC60D
MGSNISQHSSKGLKGRRARSSGDLCNGDSKSQTESSVCGSVVGDVMGWNRSLPNHLDGNRHLADYSRVNNNYGELGTYNRCQKGGRGLRYRVSKSGSDAEPVWKLQDSQFDQGYGSERSPEEECVAPLPPAVSLEQYEAELRNVYPFITEENTFTVVVEKDGRGLGMSVCGGGGLVRIRRLYPPQPAWRTGRLAPRDLLLSANGVPLAGLSTYEALEVLRTAATRVELRVCRPPSDVLESLTPPDPPTPPVRTPHPPHLPPLDPLNCHPLHARLSQTTSSATTSSSEGRGRREASPEADRRDLHLPDLDRQLPVYDIQYGEFDIVMTKVNGSLGFTLRKEDHSALGHYVRALVREPALSDGRIQPGDRIVAVNDTPMSNMSHTEAVAFLRACGAEVRLRLYRDHAATPLSPMSPKDDGPTDSDPPMNRPKPPLRPEAVSMLCDLAARRLTPDMADGSRSPCLSPRKFRKLTKDTNHYEQPTDAPSFDIKLETHSTTRTETVDGSESEPRTDTGARTSTPEARRSQRQPHTVTLASPTAPPTCRKQKLSLTVPPHGYELNNLDNDTLDPPNAYQEDIKQKYTESVFPVDSNEPVSMPVELSSDESRFKHSNPTYQSAVLHTSSSEATSDGHKDDGNGLKKWKGVALSPDKERKVIIPEAPAPMPPEPIQKENIEPEPTTDCITNEPTIVTVELNRGWNSRLGFSVQSHPDSGQSYISAVYSDSVAARDGRLRQGDVILQVNDENVTSMKTPEVIDLLRILRGSICITVLRPPTS